MRKILFPLKCIAAALLSPLLLIALVALLVSLLVPSVPLQMAVFAAFRKFSTAFLNG